MFKLDLNVRDLLGSLKIQWTEGVVKVSDIDLTSSERSQNRYTTHQEAVSIYEEQYRAGVKFPAPVLESRNGKYEIWDGNARCRAVWKTDIEEIDVAIVHDFTEKQKLIFLACTNAAHGIPLDTRERLDSAVLLVANGVPVKRAALLTGASAKGLQDRLRVDKVRSRLAGSGKDLPDPIVARLSAISSDNVLKPAANLTASANLTRDEVVDLLKAIKRAHTESEQMSVVKEYAKDMHLREKATGGGIAPLPRELRTLELLLTRLGRFEPSILAGVDPSYTDEIRNLVKHAYERLDQIGEMLA